MSQPSARPSLIVHSIARRLGTGSEPGWPRQTGHVWVFGSAPNPDSQRQNIFVRVLSWTWISRPMTGSHSVSGTLEQLLRLAHGALDVALDLHPGHPVLEREPVDADDPELALAGVEAELRVPDQHRSAGVDDAHRLPEDALARRHEVGRGIADRPHLSR